MAAGPGGSDAHNALDRGGRVPGAAAARGSRRPGRARLPAPRDQLPVGRVGHLRTDGSGARARLPGQLAGQPTLHRPIAVADAAGAGPPARAHAGRDLRVLRRASAAGHQRWPDPPSDDGVRVRRRRPRAADLESAADPYAGWRRADGTCSATRPSRVHRNAGRAGLATGAAYRVHPASGSSRSGTTDPGSSTCRRTRCSKCRSAPGVRLVRRAELRWHAVPMVCDMALAGRGRCTIRPPRSTAGT